MPREITSCCGGEIAIANVIIPGAHPDPSRHNRGWAPDHAPVAENPIDAWDSEFGDYDNLDPRIAAEIAEFEKRVLTTSPSQTVEAAMMEYEKNYAAAYKERWPGQDRWQGIENERMRVVNIIHPYTFIRRLRAAGVAAQVSDILELDGSGSPRRHIGAARVWLNWWSLRGRIGVNAWVPDPQLGRVVPRTVATLQYPYAPEWTVVRFNRYDVPVGSRYHGWRTTLLQMILQGVVTEKEARRAFGDPLGPAALFYRQQLYQHRAMWMGIATAGLRRGWRSDEFRRSKKPANCQEPKP